jgi:MOSC domain-containing protein YiiM
VRIEGLQTGKPARAGAMRTAFGKRPVRGPVRVSRTNIEGDAQADRRYHGGPDMAVLAYLRRAFAAAADRGGPLALALAAVPALSGAWLRGEPTRV